jgi:hypothetical protein
MPMSRTTRWVACGTLGALLLAAGVAVAADGGREGGRNRRMRRMREAWITREYGKVAAGRRERLHRALRNLVDAPDDQVRAALAASRDLGRIREEARAKAAAIVVQAFKDAKDATPEQQRVLREATREKLRALREEVRPAFTDAGLKVVRTLTPEQRQRIEVAAKARRVAVDDAALARRLGMRLSHPWAEAVLKARLGE